MIPLEQQSIEFAVSKARSSQYRVLAFLLWVAALAHGLYFPREWLAVAVLAGGTGLWFCRNQWRPGRVPAGIGTWEIRIGKTDLLLFSMIIFSLAGLSQPMRVADGWLEAVRWAVYWLVYRYAWQTAGSGNGERLYRQIRAVALTGAVIGWFPVLNSIWSGSMPGVEGRLSSFLGYPNATAAFLGAVLLTGPTGSRGEVKTGHSGIKAGIQRWMGGRLSTGFLFLSFLGTGSRAGVSLLLLTVVFSYFPVLLMRGRRLSAPALRSKWYAGWNRFRRHPAMIRVVALSLALICFLVLSNIMFGPAWRHLATWQWGDTSWVSRLVYYHDGISLAFAAKGMPRAGGWLAFPTVQHIPYSTTDPHSSVVRVLLNQGVFAILLLAVWFFNLYRRLGKALRVEKGGLKVGDGVIGRRAALLFLALHSCVDADFSFGALGILFWFLVGVSMFETIVSGVHDRRQAIPETSPLDWRIRYSWSESMTQLRVQNSFAAPFRRLMILLRHGNTQGIHALEPRTTNSKSRFRGLAGAGCTLIISAGLVLIAADGAGSTGLIYNGLTLAKAAVASQNANPQTSVELWRQALQQDQTQVDWRQSLARQLLIDRNYSQGVSEIEKLLAWQPFDLTAYEWAQAEVWQAAEQARTDGDPQAAGLYRWVVALPARMQAIAGHLTPGERRLWFGSADFAIPPHIKLIAQYAQERVTPAK